MVLCGTNEALHFAWRRFSIWNRICKQKECYQSFSEEEHACCKSHMLALHHIRDILGLKTTWDQENKTVTRYCFMVNWLKRPHQTFTVQEGRAPILGCGPFDEVDDMIQVLGEIANVFLLFTQETLMIFCNSLQKKKTKKRSAVLKQLEWRNSEPRGHTKLTIQITFFWKQLHSKLQDYRVKLVHDSFTTQYCFAACNRLCHTSSWSSRILPFLFIARIKLLTDFFISSHTEVRFCSTRRSLKNIHLKCD